MTLHPSWNSLLRYLDELQTGNPEYYRVVDEVLPTLVQELVLYDDRPQDCTGGLVHYTSWENTLKMLSVSEGQAPLFRMYNYELANDPEEGDIKPPIWKQIEANVQDVFRQHTSNHTDGNNLVEGAYGCSFSTGELGVEDDLMFWRLYGGDGNGCSLRLGSSGERRNIYRVRYMDKRDNCGESSEHREVEKKLNCLLNAIDKTIQNAPSECRGEVLQSMKKAVGQILGGYFHLVKNKAYEHEQEWRLIGVNPNELDVKYSVGGDWIVRRYIEGPRMTELLTTDSKITLGPRVANKDAARKYIEHLLRIHGMRFTSVDFSEKQYRRY